MKEPSECSPESGLKSSALLCSVSAVNSQSIAIFPDSGKIEQDKSMMLCQESFSSSVNLFRTFVNLAIEIELALDFFTPQKQRGLKN